MAARVFEDHRLVHHRELEMRRRIVDRDARVFGDRDHDERDVEPARSDSVKAISSIAGSASEAIIISRLEPMPPKLVPTSSPANASMKRAVPSSATIAIRSAAVLNTRPVANVGTSAAATHVVAKITYGATRNTHDAFCASTTSLR